jgi:predicted Rossmann fold nucleotide-binding protein DprA/Smf involved in DNA uptake
MTKREVYTAIVEGRITDEVINEVKGYIATLDKTNANRKAKKTKEQSAIDEQVMAVLTNEPMLAKDIAEKSGLISQKIVASCKRLAAEGKVVITTEPKGSRNISWYALATTDEAE